MDLDEDSLRYVWTISRNGATVARLTERNPTYTFTRAGTYTATLAVTDAYGARSTASTEIVAGNEPPNVDVDIASNKSFFFPSVPVRYSVRVTDREDGSLANGRIPASRVNVSAQYLKDGPPAADTTTTRGSGGSAAARGRALIQSNDCLSCHQIDKSSIGPAYTAVARKYHGDDAAVARLVKKIREGGSGVWGQVTMPAHPRVTEAQASVEAARADLVRAERLLAERAVPARRVEDARRVTAIADARLTAALARLTQRDQVLGSGGSGASGNASLYEDDGASFKFEQGQSMTRKFTQTRSDGRVSISVAAGEGQWRPAARPIRFIVQVDGVPSRVALNGTAVPRSTGIEPVEGRVVWILDGRGFVVVETADTFGALTLELTR